MRKEYCGKKRRGSRGKGDRRNEGTFPIGVDKRYVIGCLEVRGGLPTAKYDFRSFVELLPNWGVSNRPGDGFMAGRRAQ